MAAAIASTAEGEIEPRRRCRPKKARKAAGGSARRGTADFTRLALTSRTISRSIAASRLPRHQTSHERVGGRVAFSSIHPPTHTWFFCLSLKAIRMRRSKCPVGSAKTPAKLPSALDTNKGRLLCRVHFTLRSDTKKEVAFWRYLY